jgi:hypothetical protein
MLAGRRRGVMILALVACIAVLAVGACCAAAAKGASPYGAWRQGPPAEANYFAIGVCTQDPARAKEYRALGINLILSIWDGPSDEQMKQLHEAGMAAMSEPEAWGGKAWAHRDDPGLIGWVHSDEPDNAQTETGGGYGAAIPPAKVMAAYEDMRRRDPTRPMVLCLGQGVANDGWVGRGCKMEDYPEYAKACDILMYDVYPVVGIRKPDGENYLWWVAKGVDRLREWSGGEKDIWDAVEGTHINDPDKKATPAQVKSEVWMSIIHGSMGIMYFVHQFKPSFVEAGLLIDPEMMAGVKAVNEQILSLAPVLNSPTVTGKASVKSRAAAVPIDIMVKQHDGATYVLSVGMRNAPTRGSFTVKGLPAHAKAEVLGEDRTLEVKGGRWEDEFAPYGVHLYRVR